MLPFKHRISGPVIEGRTTGSVRQIQMVLEHGMLVPLCRQLECVALCDACSSALVSRLIVEWVA